MISCPPAAGCVRLRCTLDLFFKRLVYTTARRGGRRAESGPAKLTTFFGFESAPRGPPGAGVGAAGPGRKRAAGRKIQDLTMLYTAPLVNVGCPPRGDAKWHAICRHVLRREVVRKDGRGLRVSDHICQSSKTEVERPSDRA